MMSTKFILLLIFITTVYCTAQQTNEESIFVQQVIAYIAKTGLKILVSPKILRVQIKLIVEKLIKVSLTRSALKKIPVIGALTGIGFGIWRFTKGQSYRAWGEMASGLSGATGLGAGWSLAMDAGILIADVVEQLKAEGYIG